MTCNLCGTHEATIHLTEIVNSQMVEIHLCESCAQEKGTDFKTHFGFGDLLGGLNDLEKIVKTGERRAPSTCAQCGLTYEEFGKTGRLGCASCYDSFSKMLLPMIKRLQRSIHHVGKKPARAIPEGKPPDDLKRLQERLRKSIQSEAFEDAARIRDEIRQLQDQMKKQKREKA